MIFSARSNHRLLGNGPKSAPCTKAFPVSPCGHRTRSKSIPRWSDDPSVLNFSSNVSFPDFMSIFAIKIQDLLFPVTTTRFVLRSAAIQCALLNLSSNISRETSTGFSGLPVSKTTNPGTDGSVCIQYLPITTDTPHSCFMLAPGKSKTCSAFGVEPSSPDKRKSPQLNVFT